MRFDSLRLRKWEDIPEFMRIPEVRPYWDSLNEKRIQIFLKRVFDIMVAFVLLILLFIPMALIAVLVKLDSTGPVFYRQERVTTYGRHFRIHKFRTMVNDAPQLGAAVTAKGDSRITKAGRMLRKLRIDELPQLIDVLSGDMSFVGTRPEAVTFVDRYIPEYYATLLLPAGITSEASVRFKDEEELLSGVTDVDKVYIEEVLPQKMRFNLESIRNFSLLKDILTMISTVFAVFGKKK